MYFHCGPLLMWWTRRTRVIILFGHMVWPLGGPMKSWASVRNQHRLPADVRWMWP